MTTESISTNESQVLFLSGLFLLAASIFSSSSDISSGVTGNIIAFSSYIAFLLVYFYIIGELDLPKIPTIAFGILYFVFTIGFVRDSIGLFEFSTGYSYPVSIGSAFVHTGEFAGYIIASFTLLFILPQIVHREWFFVVLVTVSTLSIIVGLPTYIVGDYEIIGITINNYTALEPFRQYGIDIPALASFWGDANAMSKIVAAGLVSSHYLYNRRRSALRFFLLILNGFGLFIANSMMAMIAVFLSYSVYFVYRFGGKKAATGYVATAGVFGSTFFLMMLAGIGTSAVDAKIGFSGRAELWQAAVYTFLQHPFLGVGIHNVGEVIAAYTPASSLAPQNSYLRIFVAGGIVGGLAYVGTLTTVVFAYLQKIQSNLDMLTLCLLILFLLIQFTDTSDPFGINKNSLIFTTTLGYTIKRAYTD